MACFNRKAFACWAFLLVLAGAAAVSCPAQAEHAECCASVNKSACVPALVAFPNGARCLDAFDALRTYGDTAPCAVGGEAETHEPAYFYLHISKTGGSSIGSLLVKLMGLRAEQLGVQKVSLESLSKAAKLLRRRAEPSYFHIERFWDDFHAAGHVAGMRNLRFFTVVREPIDHTISVWSMMRADPYKNIKRATQQTGHDPFRMSYSEWIAAWAEVVEVAKAAGASVSAASTNGATGGDEAARATAAEKCLARGKDLMQSSSIWHPSNMQTEFLGFRTGSKGRPGPNRGGGGLFASAAENWCSWHIDASRAAETRARALALVDAAWVVGVTARMADTWRVFVGRMGLSAAMRAEAMRQVERQRVVTHGTAAAANSVDVAGLKGARRLTEVDSVVYAKALTKLQRQLDELDAEG
jgi:hypothetical protein